MSWYLEFQRAPQDQVELAVLVGAIEEAFGGKLFLSRPDWDGNPRDGFRRWVQARMRLASGTAVADNEIQDESATFELTMELAIEGSYDGVNIRSADTRWIRAQLATTDGLIMDARWQRLSTALVGLGYEDQTLAGPAGEIIEQLEACGAHPRAAELRTAITDALCRKLARGPDHWPLVISFTCPDDLFRVLSAAPAPARVESITLSGLGLQEVPLESAGLARFPAARALDLSYNQLSAIPTLDEFRVYLPKLNWLSLAGNPMPKLKSSDWRGVKVVAS